MPTSFDFQTSEPAFADRELPHPLPTRTVYSRFAGATIGALLTCLWPTAAALAHDGDPHVEHEIALSYLGPQLPTGSPEARTAVEAIVQLAARVHNSHEQTLLPAGTQVDRVAWSAGVLTIDLTLPEGRTADWRLSPLDLETITNALHRPFKHDPAFAGTRV